MEWQRSESAAETICGSTPFVHRSLKRMVKKFSKKKPKCFRTVKDNQSKTKKKLQKRNLKYLAPFFPLCLVTSLLFLWHSCLFFFCPALTKKKKNKSKISGVLCATAYYFPTNSVMAAVMCKARRVYFLAPSGHLGIYFLVTKHTNDC